MHQAITLGPWSPERQLLRGSGGDFGSDSTSRAASLVDRSTQYSRLRNSRWQLWVGDLPPGTVWRSALDGQQQSPGEQPESGPRTDRHCSTSTTAA